ncbi:MAG TPA: hypothetical protein VNO74_03695 [Methylomirabilota bacterium]|nr:hypothetical protein [Methylomirabilota bacterium]
MADSKYPRGSEWRKWDLQVHTPFSALNNGFGDIFEQYAKRLFEKAVEKEIAVIGVTDYFSIEGYKQLRALVRDRERLEKLLGTEIASKAREVRLLPNIELRTSVIVKRTDGTDSRVNFHVIFSDDVEPEVIEEHFLGIKFTAESSPGHSDESWPLTILNLESLGKKLKEQNENFQASSDLYVGMLTALVPHENVTEVLESQPSRFRDRYLVVVPADEDLSECNWDGQGHLARKLLIQKSHMLFSSNGGTRDFGLGKKHPTPPDFVKEFKSLKPCIHGSDAHAYDNLFEPAQRRRLWIKANPTFQGLRQLLHEPETRVYIGDEPPFLSRVRDNKTKYMSTIEFERTAQAKPTEIWFSDEVPLNHGLVAIIGNKGSGKSALADILALVGDTRNSRHFSFLTDQRFLAPKTMLGDMFRATVTWHSNLEVSRLLSATVDETSPELIKYIPQNYLETICSELKESRETQFDRELMEVIFSHVDDPARLGIDTLPALIAYLTNEKEDSIAQLSTDLANVNSIIVALEDQLTEEHKKALEAQLAQKRAELKAHEDAKPIVVTEPTGDPLTLAATEQIRKELEELVVQAQQLDKDIGDAQAELRTTARQIAAADRLLTRLDNLEKQIVTFHADSMGDASALNIDTKKIVSFTVDRQPIVDVKANANTRSQAATASIAPSVSGSLTTLRTEVSTKTAATRAKLDEPNRLYQEYLHALANWQKRYNEIQGSLGVATSVKGLEAKLAALSGIPSQLAKQKTERSSIVSEIFKTKLRLLEDYRRLYAPVQKFIDEHEVSRAQAALQFSASIAVDGLVDGLLEMIHQGRKGSFQGEPEGRERFGELLKRQDLSTEPGVMNFLIELQDHLEHDKGAVGNASVKLRDQLRQGKEPEDLYNYVYGLGYLKPRFELVWQNKPLDQLSPGERGTLLLVFYLLIDSRDVPLIIDQPEENLDNQTIATMLVPAIKYAKAHRQIIMVTHNPNLAVVCDAEQVIHSSLGKAAGNRVIYKTGGIEDPQIVQLIVDVLEGTKPAFDLRDAKYQVLDHP